MARKAIRLKGANLVIANARNVQFQSQARCDVRLRYALGSQVALVNAIIKAIIDGNLVDLKKVEAFDEQLSGIAQPVKQL